MAVGDQGEREVAAAKDDLLRQIEHLRREVAYDYPPERTRLLADRVMVCHRALADAWKGWRAEFREARELPVHDLRGME